ncbi:MAG: FMN-binding glutamate synthase family protein, partial [Deltaproteobacteria bacterium]
LGEEAFEKIPAGALGLYTYYERLAQGLRQFMAGSRKFSLEHLSREDLAALTPEAAEISGIRYMMEADRELAEKILNW